MIRVVVDTNVIVSGVINSSGNPGIVLQAILEGNRLLLVTSEAILREVGPVLRRPRITRRHGLSSREITLLLARLASAAVIAPGCPSLNAVPDDPTDAMFLAAALEGEAAYVVSGDRHLLRLGEYRGVAIVSPTELLDRVLLDD